MLRIVFSCKNIGVVPISLVNYLFEKHKIGIHMKLSSFLVDKYLECSSVVKLLIQIF